MESQYLPKVIFLPLKLVLLVACVLAEDIRVSMEAHITVNNKTLMSYKVEPLPDSYNLLGEGPHWDIPSQNLYLVDLRVGKICRYDYKQNKMYKCQIENAEFASFIIPIEGTKDKFAVGVERRVVVVTWDGFSERCKIEKEIVCVEQDSKYDDNRFNDAKCDPRGRLFGGTMRKEKYELRTGNFFRIDHNGKLTHLIGDVGISNGLAWNEKLKKFYYIDSLDFNVKEYDYDINTGEISNPKVVFDFHNLRGDGKEFLPDGMTIDAEGNLYVATDGSIIFKIDPRSGKNLLEIEMPCEQITSAAFGGPNLDILYVTTSAVHGKPAPAGTTYKVTGLGTKGLPMTNFKLKG